MSLVFGPGLCLIQDREIVVEAIGPKNFPFLGGAWGMTGAGVVKWCWLTKVF